MQRRALHRFVPATVIVAAILAPAPNAQEPTTITYGENQMASISPVGDIDTFTFTGEPGEKLIILSTWAAGSADFQPCLELRDPNGTLLAQACTGAYSSRIDTEIPGTSPAGAYQIIVSDAPGIAASGDYSVSLQRVFPLPGVDCPVLTFPQDSFQEFIWPTADLDCYTFTARAGSQIRLAATKTGGDASFEPCIELYGPDGSGVGRACLPQRSNILEMTLPAAGSYIAIVSDFNGNPGDRASLGDGSYLITLECLSVDCDVVAEYETFGTGCLSATTGLIPTMTPAPGSLPRLGEVFVLNLTNIPPDPPFDPLNTPFIVTSMFELDPPLDLSFIGMTGCTLYVGNPFIVAAADNINGSATFDFPIPLDPALLGAPLVNQGGVLDPGANPAGVTAANAGRGTIGM